MTIVIEKAAGKVEKRLSLGPSAHRIGEAAETGKKESRMEHLHSAEEILRKVIEKCFEGAPRIKMRLHEVEQARKH